MAKIITCKRCGRKRKHYAKGLCRSCHATLRRNPDAIIRKFYRGKLIVCKRCGRKRKYFAKGFCRSCYSTARRYPNAKLWIPPQSIKIERVSEQVLLGSLLGDAGLYLYGYCKNPYYSEGHCIAQKDYLQWKQLLLPFETKYDEYIDKKSGGKYCKIWSRCHPELKRYYGLRYRNKNALKEMLNILDTFGLLIWYLDDGGYSQYRNVVRLNRKMTIAHYSIICKWFVERYKAIPNLAKSKKRIYFSVVDSKKILTLFQPYIRQVPKSMHYKFGMDKKKRIEAKKKWRAYVKKYRQRPDVKKRRIKEARDYYRKNKDKILKRNKVYKKRIKNLMFKER